MYYYYPTAPSGRPPKPLADSSKAGVVLEFTYFYSISNLLPKNL